MKQKWLKALFLPVIIFFIISGCSVEMDEDLETAVANGWISDDLEELEKKVEEDTKNDNGDTTGNPDPIDTTGNPDPIGPADIGSIDENVNTAHKMISIQGGCFQMGSPEEDSDADSDEYPRHRVCLSDYHIGEHEVTQGQWKTIMNSNPSSFSSCGDKCPVESVSWDDVQTFIEKLNQNSGETYRLPTEAEWEYAARGRGEDQKYSGTSDGGRLGEYAWYFNNSNSKTHPVKGKKPNGIGLYDMSGNVWEWVNDWYSDSYYSDRDQDDPKGPDSGTRRVYRGGSGFNTARRTRAANRGYNTPDSRYYNFGFRLARTN